MDPALKKALQISGGAHLVLILAMLVNFNFFDNNEVIVVPLYSSTNAPLQASVVDNPKLKEAEKATKKKPEPKKEPPKKEEPKEEPKKEPEVDPKEELLKKQQEAKVLQAKKEAEVKKKREADIALKKKKELDKKKEQDKKKADELKKKQADELKKKKAEALKTKKAEELKKKKAEELKKKKIEDKKRQQELERQAEEQLLEDELAEEADEARRAARQGQLLTEKQRYVAMIVERVRQSWFTDDTMNGKECVISLNLASNGFVIDMQVEGGDRGVCDAAVNAINRVGRFPMPEDPDLNAEFRQLKLPFKK